ncbi:MAG: PSP1 domain-containing protein [Aminivibrio sp.]
MSIYLAIFGKPRYIGLFDLPQPAEDSLLVAETMRGTELAILGGHLSAEQEERYRRTCGNEYSDGQMKGGEPSLQEITFLREATEEDIKEADLAREEEDFVLMKAREILKNHNLPMKLVDVEFLLDRKKLFFYFTSEQRVDFRAFVRDLAKEFRTRIELRQIGVRDEAKAVKGLGPCGRRCCCSSWLHKFTPICIKMVKEQNLALNPTKISGICGRLMCCMSYEHHLYEELWKGLPNPGSKIKTTGGNYLMDGVVITSGSIRVRAPEGKEILVKVDDFDKFRETVMAGGTWDDQVLAELPEDSGEDRSRGQKRRPPEMRDKPSGGGTPSRQEKQAATEKPPAGAEEKAKSPRGGAKKKRRRKKSAPKAARTEAVEKQTTSSSEGKGDGREKQPSGEGQKKRSQPRRRRSPGRSGDSSQQQRQKTKKAPEE